MSLHPPGESIVEVPGGRLFVTSGGEGPAIVLLHAGIVDSRAWDPLVPHLVSAGFRAIRYDRRGFGRSETDDVAFSNRADLVAVLDALEIDRACLVGNSQGGQIAADTAIEFPGRVSSLVLVSANIGGYEPEPTPQEAALFAEMERLEASGDPDAAIDFHIRAWVDGPGQPTDRVPAALREAVRTMGRPLGVPGLVTGRPIPLLPRAADRLDALTLPILAVVGELDVSDLWATAQHLIECCPNVRAVKLPHVAHLIGMEVPSVLAYLITDFLRPQRGAPR
jgi:3-oxoadipate enol-lactonase